MSLQPEKVLANSSDSSDFEQDPSNKNLKTRRESKSKDEGRSREDDSKSTIVETTSKKSKKDDKNQPQTAPTSPKNKSLTTPKKSLKLSLEKTKTSTKQEQEEDEQREESVVRFEQYLMVRLERALRQFYAVIDKIRAVSGKKIYYRYSTELDERQRKIPIVWGCKTLVEFFAENERILGRDLLLRLFVESGIQKSPEQTTSSLAKVKFQAIGVNYTEEEITRLKSIFKDEVARLERIFKKKDSDLITYIGDKEWLKCVINDVAFEFIMDSVSGVFGALEMAAREIGYPLKDLIYSDDVNFFFAQYVARKFVSPNQNVQADRTDGSTVQYRIHGGFYTNQQDTKWLLGFKELVKNFYYVEDPDIKNFFGNDLNDLKARKNEMIQKANDNKQKQHSEDEILVLSNLKNSDKEVLDAATAINLYRKTEKVYNGGLFFARVLKIKKGSY